MNTTVLPYYTINASLLQYKANIVMGPHTKLNIFLNTEAELTPKLYTFLDSIQNDYIVSLSASLLLNADLLAKIYLLFVLNKSGRAQKTVPIFTDNTYPQHILDIGILKTYLNQQGITDIEFPVFNYGIAGNQTIENCSLLLQQDQSTYLQKEFAENNEYANILIIASTDAINNLITLTDLKKQLTFFEESNFSNITFSKYYIEKEEFESERNLWKQRTLVYQDFLSLSKKVQEKEYYEVLDWYHNEYENLPLWYKQFGHIIKVIMGKRSFRSLFDDNVKKYKD